jgi:23S rRNA pseudouridine1911/1915/1917 synthase
MAELFRVGEVHKTYHAIVPLGNIKESDTLVGYMIKDGRLNRSRCYATPVNATAKRAITHYRVVGRGDKYMAVYVTLETGRHHQIRCHFASLGLPIKGDLKYGSPRSNDDGGISLHARRVEFIHPVSGEKISITAPYPQSDAVLWQALGEKE